MIWEKYLAKRRKWLLHLYLTIQMVISAWAQGGHPPPTPVPAGVRAVQCSKRPVPQLDDITQKLNISLGKYCWTKGRQAMPLCISRRRLVFLLRRTMCITSFRPHIASNHGWQTLIGSLRFTATLRHTIGTAALSRVRPLRLSNVDMGEIFG